MDLSVVGIVLIVISMLIFPINSDIALLLLAVCAVLVAVLIFLVILISVARE